MADAPAAERGRTAQMPWSAFLIESALRWRGMGRRAHASFAFALCMRFNAASLLAYLLTYSPPKSGFDFVTCDNYLLSKVTPGAGFPPSNNMGGTSLPPLPSRLYKTQYPDRFKGPTSLNDASRILSYCLPRADASKARHPPLRVLPASLWTAWHNDKAVAPP
jgi:hypothetical protein